MKNRKRKEMVMNNFIDKINISGNPIIVAFKLKDFEYVKRVIILLSACFSVLTIAAQTDSLVSFFKHEQSLLREKLYLHTDKPYYSAGDNLWFRGTLVNADTHSYLVKTNFIYVELLTVTDSLVIRKKLKRDGLCFHNCFPLEMDLPEGDYYLRGYTEWMRNFDSCYFYSRKLSVCNVVSKGVIPPVKSRDYSVTFLPEGGALLADVSQRVAFIAQRSDGHSEQVHGSVYTEQGDTLVRFVTAHNGMGTVELTAPAGVRLFAKTTAVVDGMERTFPLPQADVTGIALQVHTENDTLLCIRALTAKGMSLPGGLRLVTHVRGLYTGDMLIGADTVLSTKGWPDGINHLLLCTVDGRTLSRRLVFVGNSINAECWTVKTDRSSYNKRERVRMEFTVTDEQSHPLQGDFSVSVTDAAVIETDSVVDNIVSNLLLNSDLKGTVEESGWYFRRDINRLPLLDLVMLTHGWSRFETNNLFQSNEYMLPYGIEAGQYITGRVEGIPEKEKGNLISAYNPEDRQFATDVIQPDGTFCLNGLDFPDSTYFGIRLLSKKKSQRKIYIDKATYPESNYKGQFISYPQQPKLARKNYTPENMISFMLPDVEVQESKRSQFWVDGNSRYASAWNVQELQTLYDPNSLVTVLDLVNELIKTTHSGLIFGHGCIDYLDGINHEQNAVWGPLKTAMVNTNTYVGYEQIYSALSRISLYSIERIEIHRGTPIDYWQKKKNMELNTSQASHRLEITAPVATMTSSTIFIRFKPGGDYMKTAPDPRKRIVWPKGYDWPAYFYHPAYEMAEQKGLEKADKRTTLYWNPSVQTDKDGRGSVIFYTSDSPKNYNVQIEGVTFNGRVCREERRIM